MASFHDQWMYAHTEVAALPERDRPALEEKLSYANELINEENDPKDRRLGGEIIRFVRQDARQLQERPA